MNFSELFRQSVRLCKFSPDGKYLASGTDYRLVIRDVETLQIQHLYSCLDAIQYIEWSCDSLFILCGMYKRGLVQVWSIENQEWTCKIDEGSAGLAAVRWSPDGRHILTTADFHLRITVWSLTTKSVSYIRYPKDCKKGLDFSSNGKYLALAERRDCNDHISIFSCQSWSLVKHFECATDDLDMVEWSPDCRALCVCDSSLTYKVVLYSLDGRLLGQFSPYDDNLGIKSMSWSPSSQFLALGSFDEKVRILNHITWKTVATLSHPDTIEAPNAVVYTESESRTPALPAGLGAAPTVSLFTPQSKYEVQSCPVSVPVKKPSGNKANPKIGVGKVSFSHNNKYMLTMNDNMPCVLWVWDVSQLSLCAALVQASPIKCVSWDPSRPRLAMCCGNNKLYMWSPDGALSVEVPVEGTFLIHQLVWHPDGDAILLVGKEQMCVCFLTTTSEANSTAAQNISTITLANNNNSSNNNSDSNKGLQQGGGNCNITTITNGNTTNGRTDGDETAKSGV